MANLLFRLYSWLILGYFWQRRVFVRLFILTLRYVRDARARLLLTIDTHAHVSMDATLSVHVKVISYDRNGHVSTKCKDFQNKKNRKRKKITRPWNEVRSHVVGYIIYTCIYCIKDTMFHDVLDSFFIRGRRRPVVVYTLQSFSSSLHFLRSVYTRVLFFSRFSITRSFVNDPCAPFFAFTPLVFCHKYIRNKTISLITPLVRDDETYSWGL